MVFLGWLKESSVKPSGLLLGNLPPRKVPPEEEPARRDRGRQQRGSLEPTATGVPGTLKRWLMDISDINSSDINRGAGSEPDDLGEQLELFPADGYVEPIRYAPCPRQGTHLRLTDCWMCWCDEHRDAPQPADLAQVEPADIDELLAPLSAAGYAAPRRYLPCPRCGSHLRLSATG